MFGKFRITLVSLNVDHKTCKNYSLAIQYLRLYAMCDPEIARRATFTTLDLNCARGSFWRILLTRPDIVGFSCSIWNITQVLEQCRRLKKYLPRVKIVLGGQEVTNSQVDFMAECPQIDVLVDGEGEDTFRDLILTWLQWGREASLEAVAGIRWRRRNLVVTNQPRPLIEDLDTIPSPYLAGCLIPKNEHHLGMMIETSRGCPFHCTFCFEGSKYPSVRNFPLARIEREIAWAISRGIRHFHILDPILANCNLQRLQKIQEILSRHMSACSKYRISVEIYAELIKPEILPSLAPFTIFDVGLQTIQPQALKNIRRYYDKDKFERGVNLLKTLNRRINIYLILGIPGETYYSFWIGIRYVLALKPAGVFFNHLLVLNGTDLRRNSKTLGLRFQPQPRYRVIETPSLPQRSLLRASVLSSSLMNEYNMKLTGSRQP